MSNAKYLYQSMRHFERKAAWLDRCAMANESSPHFSHRLCAQHNSEEAQECDELAAEYREELGL